MKSKILCSTLGVVLLLIGLISGVWYLDKYDDVFYTQIDNSSVKELSGDSDMKYEYELDCYNKSGKKKTFKFKTYKILRNEAYLKLNVTSFGVHDWEEITLKEIPEKAQQKLE